MSKEFLNTTDISDTFAGVPRKQKFVTNPTPSAVTRYVCISKEADGSSHSQPLAFWESVRNNDPVVTQHVCSFEESGSDVSSSVASTNVVLKKHVAVIPADAIPAFPGFCSAERLDQKRYNQHEHVSHKQHPPAHIKSCREQQKSTRITPHTWREQVQIIKKEDAIAAAGGVNSIVTVSAVKLKDNVGSSVITKSVISEAEAQTALTECISATNPGDIIIEKNIITSQRNDKEFHELDRGDLDVNEPEVLSADGNNAGTEKLATNIKVKSVGSMQRASTEVNDLKNADSEKKCTSDTPKRKLFHNRNKTREYILQQKQKRKERFATEQSKKNMEDEMKKVKLQTLREKSRRIVKTNVKKSLSKKRSPEKINNLGPDTAIDRNGKEDDLQTPDVAITMKSVTQKSVSVTKYKVTESIPSRDRLSAERDNDIDMAHNSSLPDSNGGNSNKSSSVDRELKGDQQIRNELDLKIRAVAKALSAELESNILHSSYDLTDKVTNDRNHLSLQRPLYRLRDTVCSRQPVTHNMENSRVVNTDSAIINISDSPPTKLKRYDHRKQMKSLEKKMELANNTISMLRENNIIKSFERSTREQAGSVKGPEKILKENSIELEKKSRQKTVDSPQQYFSKRSAFPFCPEQHSETTEKSRKLLKKQRIADKTNHVQNHSGTSTQTALNHVPQISMKYSPPTSPHISESGIIGKSENVQPQVRKHLDEVINLNCLPSSFPNNLQTIERNTHVTPVEQKKDPERRHERVKNRQTADDDYNKRSDRKSQLQTDMVTTHSDPVKDCEIKVQANEKLKKLLMQQAFEKDQYAANSPLTRDVTTRSSGAAAELFKRAVEHEKRERAATRIQALYRGHSTRKITDSLLIGTKSKSDVQQTQLQEEQHHNSTKKETWFKEDLSGSKLNTGEPTDWLELEPVKPCPYNVMTAVRQKLLALKVLDAKVETKTANICTDRTLAGDKSGIEGNNKSTLDQNKEVCTSGFWVEENAIVQTNTVAPATENKKKVQAVQLCSSKENSLSNAEGRSGNRKTSGSDKSYVFSEEAGWIENEEPEQKGIGSLHLSTVNKTNITQHSRNQGKTRESSAKSSIVGSDKEHSLTCSLRNNSESLSLPDVHLVRKRRSSENETVSIPSNSKEPYLSGVKERENSLPTSKADWIEASVHLSSPQTSFPSETNNRTKNNESETHYKKNITETKSDHSAKNSNNSKETMSSIDISDGGHAEKSSIQCTGTPLETETKKTGSSHSGSSANWSRNRHKFHKVLESGKMMPPEALHLQFQAEINLLESLEESRLRLAQIEGLHALSLIQHQNCPVTTQQKDEREQQVQVTSDHQQQRAPKQDKIDDFEKNRREFNTVIESMRRCATLSGVDPEIIDWLTFSDVSSPVKESNTEVRFQKQEKELFQTEKNVLNNSENNSFGENREMQNVKYSYDSSFTSVSEDISGQTNSTKSKHSKLNSLSESTVTKILDAALKKGQISIAAYCKYAKLIQEEAMRAHEQDILLDTTEQALLDRFKTDMMSLETNKRQLKQCGKENLVPSVKKKQRALVLKLEHDREEIKRLRNMYMEASKEWRNLLLQHLNLAKCNVTDNKTLGTTLQERALTTATSISTEPGNPMNSETKKSVVPSTSPVQTEVSSSIQTELSQHSAQSTRSVGSGSWSSNQKKENSPVQSSVDVCTDLTKTETAAQTNSAESRHSLLPSKRLWSHDEISNWEQSPGEDKTRVRPFRYHRDHSISPMRVLKTEKQNINLSGSADFLHMENNSATTCFDRDFISVKNSSSARAVPVKGSNNKNSSASQETAETVSSAEVLCKGSDASIRMSVSPQSGMRRQSSGSDESVMLSQGDTPSEQSDLEGRVCALREQLRRRELEAEQLKKLQRKKARREELKATEQSLLKQIQALDSYINRIKEQLKQNFNTSPLLAVKPKIKQPRVQTEQISKHILGRTKEKSEPCKQTERKSNQVLDKVEYESPLDDSSQKSISNGLSTEIPTVISEQTANSVKFLPEDTNSITFREAHTSEDDNHQDDIVSVSGSYERTEGPDSTEDYISQEKNSYSKNKNAIIKTSSMKEISSLSSEQQCSGYVKHTKSEQSFSARALNDGVSIIPTMLASGDDFVEEDREISEILVNSTFDMINAEVSSTQQCKGSKNDYTQESCVSSSFKPLENSSEAKSNNLFSERSDSSLNNVVPHRTVSKSCTSATINEELSEIEETSVSIQQISDTTEVQKASSADSIQHEISEKSDLESENVVNVTDLVCAPQNVGDTFCILTSDIKAMNASPSILAAGEEKGEDSTQELLLSTESRNQPSEKELSEESVLNVYSHTNQGRDGIEFCHSADDSICTESHPVSVQLSSTFVVEHEEHTPEAQTVEQSKITVGSEKNDNRMQKLKLVDSITESIMLQLLKDSFVSPDIKLKECGEVPDGNASRETVLSYAHKFSETTKPEVGVISEIQCDSRTVILDEAEKQENLAIEKEPHTINDICIGNTTFIIDESSKSEKNTSVLVDEMLNHFLENATSDVLTIYNAKISNSDRLCVPSEDCKQSPSIEILESRDNSDLSPLDRDSICKPSEIINVTLQNNNTHLSVDDMINNDVVKDSFHNSKKINVIENEMQDMISFTSPDSRKVQELSVEDVLKPFSEHSTCEKLMTRTDREQPHENRSDDVSSGSLITDEGDSLLHHGLTTADEVVMSEEHLANGCKSKVGTQNGNKLKDISHLQKVEVRGKQTLNNETFPPGWFDEDLDLSNSWREAEQLRLQQLHIEQEIRRLEEQQHQQQALVLVREIPDKPPPPYTPRGTTLLSSSVLCPPPAIGASAPRHRLIELVAEATPLLISTGTLPVLPPEDFCTGYNPSIRKFIFDLSSSLVNEAVSVPCTDDEYGEETPRQQMTVKRSQEAVRAHVTRRATALLDGSAGAGSGSAGKLRRLAIGPRWRRRDHVDELLVREARDEEPGWIDYRRDEAQLRNETACALLHDLLDDTVTAITTAITRRMAPKTTGVM